MRLRVYRNQPVVRFFGVLTGLGFLAIGIFSVVGPGYELTALERDRSLWFGITAIIGGIWAVAASLLDSDLTGVWCRRPNDPPRDAPVRPGGKS